MNCNLLNSDLPFGLPQGWSVVRADDYCIKVADGTHDSPKRIYIGKKLVTSKHITSGVLNLNDAYYISDEDYDVINRRSKVDRNDVLLSMIGTVGQACFIDVEPEFAIKNVGLLKNDDPIKAKWLFFWLCTPYAQQMIKERLRGTTQQYLPLGEIRKFPIPFPDNPEVMQTVVKILSDITDKIHLNTKINQTLEQIAQAIFKSWFVDFDPVKAKMAVLESGGTQEEAERAAMGAISGKDEAALEAFKEENPEGYEQLAETAALFPAGMVESELGEIPEGWEVGKLEQTLNLLYGKALKKTARFDGDYPVYGSGGINGYHNKALVAGPGIIVGRKGTVGSVFWEDANFFPIDTVFYVEPKDKIPLPFLFYLLKTLGLENMNTDAAVPGLNRNNAYRLDIVIPDISILERFDKAAGLSRKSIKSNCDENKILAQIRDTLLPRLLSGEIELQPTYSGEGNI